MEKLLFIRAVCSIMLSLSLGLTAGIIGPTLVHLRYILKTDTQGMGMSFIGENLGTILGALLAAFLFKRFNQELLFSLASLLLGCCLGYAPWTPHLYAYYIVITIQSMAHGFIESGLQTYILNLWAGHKCKGTILHVANMIETVGNFVCPFVVIPFLSELPTDLNLHDVIPSSNSSSSWQTSNNTIEGINASQNTTSSNCSIYPEGILQNITGIKEEMGRQSGIDLFTVRYAYLTITVPIFITTSLFMIAFLFVKLFKDKDKNTLAKRMSVAINEKTENPTSYIVKPYKYVLLIFVGLYIALVMQPEYTFSIYLSTFVIDGLHWSARKGSLITSVFRGTQGLGQVLGIPLSLVLSPNKMLIINMLTGFVAFTMLSCVPLYSSGSIDIIMWLSVGLAGLAVSTMYAGTILWGAQYIKADASYGSTFVISTALGGMIEAALTGYLMQHHSHMWVVYLALAAILGNMILFIVMFFSVKHIKKYCLPDEGFLPDKALKNKLQTETLLAENCKIIHT